MRTAPEGTRADAPTDGQRVAGASRQAVGKGQAATHGIGTLHPARWAAEGAGRRAAGGFGSGRCMRGNKRVTRRDMGTAKIGDRAASGDDSTTFGCKLRELTLPLSFRCSREGGADHLVSFAMDWQVTETCCTGSCTREPRNCLQYASPHRCSSHCSMSHACDRVGSRTCRTPSSFLVLAELAHVCHESPYLPKPGSPLHPTLRDRLQVMFGSTREYVIARGCAIPAGPMPPTHHHDRHIVGGTMAGLAAVRSAAAPGPPGSTPRARPRPRFATHRYGLDRVGCYEARACSRWRALGWSPLRRCGNPQPAAIPRLSPILTFTPTCAHPTSHIHAIAIPAAESHGDFLKATVAADNLDTVSGTLGRPCCRNWGANVAGRNERTTIRMDGDVSNARGNPGCESVSPNKYHGSLFFRTHLQPERSAVRPVGLQLAHFVRREGMQPAQNRP